MNLSLPQQAATGSRTNAQLRDEATQRMIATAIRLIAEKGASRVSLVDVGREAGYSHSLPNYYFETKSGLLQQVYTHIIQAAGGKIVRWCRKTLPDPVRPGMSNVRATIRAYLALVGEDPAATRAMHILWAEAVSSLPELLDIVRPMNKRTLDFFGAELREAMRRGEIDPQTDVDMMSLLIMSTLRGAVAQHMADPEQVDLNQVAEALIALLDRGIGIKPNALAGEVRP